jgi:hypothetical protein
LLDAPSVRFSIHIEGEGASEIPRNEDNYVVKGIETPTM